MPLSPRLDFVGPLARNVADAGLLLDPIFVRGEREPGPSSTHKRSRKAVTLRLGLPKEFFFDVISEDVYIAFHETVRSLQKRGAKLREVSIPHLAETEEAGNHIAWAEATHYHQQAGWFPARSADYGEDVRVRLEMGVKVSATAYLKALEARDKFIQQFHLAMTDAGVDALAVPTTPITAPLIGEASTRIGEKDHPIRALLLRLNRPANLAGVPAISIPCGFSPSGLPIGLQLIGLHTAELALLQIAHTFELAHPLQRQPRLD